MRGNMSAYRGFIWAITKPVRALGHTILMRYIWFACQHRRQSKPKYFLTVLNILNKSLFHAVMHVVSMDGMGLRTTGEQVCLDFRQFQWFLFLFFLLLYCVTISIKNVDLQSDGNVMQSTFYRQAFRVARNKRFGHEHSLLFWFTDPI